MRFPLRPSVSRFLYSTGLFFLAGCAASAPQNDLQRLTREQSATIQSLTQEVQRLNTELAAVKAQSQSES